MNDLEQSGPKLHYMGDSHPGPRGGKLYVFHCPGCQCGHPVEVDAPNGAGWTWNRSMDAPTFSPSLLCNRGHESQCHSFIADGKIQFLSDCWHPLVGQTVEIPDWDGVEEWVPDQHPPDSPAIAPGADSEHESLVCMECGARVSADSVSQHFEQVHTIDGAPQWEQGWACRPEDVPTMPPWRGAGADRREVVVREVRPGYTE